RSWHRSVLSPSPSTSRTGKRTTSDPYGGTSRARSRPHGFAAREVATTAPQKARLPPRTPRTRGCHPRTMARGLVAREPWHAGLSPANHGTRGYRREPTARGFPASVRRPPLSAGRRRPRRGPRQEQMRTSWRSSTTTTRGRPSSPQDSVPVDGPAKGRALISRGHPGCRSHDGRETGIPSAVIRAWAPVVVRLTGGPATASGRTVLRERGGGGSPRTRRIPRVLRTRKRPAITPETSSAAFVPSTMKVKTRYTSPIAARMVVIVFFALFFWLFDMEVRLGFPVSGAFTGI